MGDARHELPPSVGRRHGVGDQPVKADDKVGLLPHLRPIGTRRSSTGRAFDIGRDPNPHIAFGGGGPHFCLGANLARMEIRVMFEHLLDRMPDLAQAGPTERLRSNFINGIKHLPVSFTPGATSPGAGR